MIKKIEISHKTIIFTAAFVGLLWFAYLIKDIILELFMALLLASIFSPIVTKLTSLKIPKGLSILISYILIIGLFVSVVWMILPPVIEQTSNLINGLPKYIQDLRLDGYINESFLKDSVSQISNLPGQVIKTGLSLFNNVLSVISVAILTFYLLLSKDKLGQTIESLVGKEKAKKAIEVVDNLERELGGWARGQLILMFMVGSVSYVGFLLLGIPYALPLSLLAGVLEVVPYLGPIIAALPVAIIAFNNSLFMGFAAISLSILVQQIENHIFVPKIMEKTAGVSPIVILLALAIGYRLAGITGIILSVPLVVVAKTLIVYRFGK